MLTRFSGSLHRRLVGDEHRFGFQNRVNLAQIVEEQGRAGRGQLDNRIGEAETRCNFD